MTPLKTLCLGFATVVGISGSCLAGPVAETTVTQRETWSAFAKGNTELELMVGAFGGLSSTDTPKRPDYGFALASLRYGWMLNDPSGSGCLRGNWEFMIGAFGGPIFEGPGDYHVGADLVLRYNFVQPGAKVIPFFQISAGGDFSDVVDDPVQDYLGTEWNWALGSSIGVRWMLSDRMALTTAFEWRHFSNGGSSDRNRGYNGLGGMIGLAWFY
jgi:hypothetical protein